MLLRNASEQGYTQQTYHLNIIFGPVHDTTTRAAPAIVVCGAVDG